jgi:hypothetical protein
VPVPVPQEHEAVDDEAREEALRARLGSRPHTAAWCDSSLTGPQRQW